MTFKCKLCLLKDLLQQLCSAQRAEMSPSTKKLQQPPADEVKHKLESNMPKPRVIISCLQKVVISLNEVQHLTACSTFCRVFSLFFMFCGGGVFL